MNMLPSLRASSAEWAWRLGPEFPVVSPLLRKTGRLAAEMPPLDRHAGDASFRRLQRDDGTHYGVAEDGATTEYSEDDVAILEVSLQDLCTRIALALGVTPSPKCQSAIPAAYLVGSFERKGQRHPVYLIITTDEDRGLQAIATIVARAEAAIVLLPDQRHVDILLRKDAATRGVALMALSDILAIADDGVLIPTQAPALIMATAAGRANDEPEIRDGVRDRHCIIINGVEHRCDLTQREFEFLKVAWDRTEVRLDEMLHINHGLIAKTRFNNSRHHRNQISRFLTALNTKLVDSKPPVARSYCLPKSSDTVVRNIT